MEPRVSIVMPIFNGARYLNRTLDSIISQDFESFEVLCVDDGSTDASLEIIKKFECADPRVRVIQTPTNLGIVPKVMNFVRPYLRGRYFVYTSQDDFFSTDWLSSMYAIAAAENAAAVVPNLVFWYGEQDVRNRLIGSASTSPRPAVSGRDAFELSLDWTIPGNALWDVRLIMHTPYFDFSMNGDEYTARVYFLMCEKVFFAPGTFFYFQGNPLSITKKLTAKSLSTPLTDLRLARLAADHGFESTISSALLRRSVLGMSGLMNRAIDAGLPSEVIQRSVEQFVATMNAVRGWDFESSRWSLDYSLRRQLLWHPKLGIFALRVRRKFRAILNHFGFQRDVKLEKAEP